MAATETRAAKRKRKDNLNNEQARRSQPWFEDGNIILEAEATQFRVYRGILAANSVIFKDMFEFGKPTNEGSVEGCPLVQLSDSAEDLQYVLEVLYNAHSRCAYWH
jgi:hypothetical protein